MWEVPSQYLREIESRVLKIKRLMVLHKKRLNISVAYSHDLKRKKVLTPSMMTKTLMMMSQHVLGITEGNEVHFIL